MECAGRTAYCQASSVVTAPAVVAAFALAITWADRPPPRAPRVLSCRANRHAYGAPLHNPYLPMVFSQVALKGHSAYPVIPYRPHPTALWMSLQVSERRDPGQREGR